LARVLRALAADPVRRQTLARAGTQRARGRYSWTRVAAETLDVYRALTVRSRATDAFGGGVS
jgi:glycosyltransferase involved in cell wall biosynthesis